MQTFVLAPQTPKKFYVHNDIFRYQDEVYQDNSDTESDEPQPVETSAKLNYYHQTVNNEQSIQQDEVVTQSNSSASSSTAPILSSPSAVLIEQQKPEEHLEHESESNLVNAEETNGLSNGHLTTSMTHIEQQQEKEEPETNEEIEVVEAPVQVESAPVENKTELYVENPPQPETIEIKINSWAKIISSSSGAGQTSSVSVTNVDSNVLTGTNSQVYQTQNNNSQKFIPKENVSSSTKPTGKNPNQMNGKPNKPRNPPQQHQQQQQQQPQQLPPPPPPSSQQQQQQQQQQPQQQSQQPKPAGSDLNIVDENEKRFGRYPDGQQVFVGNLNQDLSEVELRSFFGQFGKVVDVRINTNTKQQSGRRLPNYGFVVFDDKQSVEYLLSQSKANSLTYKNEKGIEYRLNVEEKRARQGRVSSGFGGNKSNRVTRSSSNGSRNGTFNNNNNNNPKKNTNYSSNTHETGYINERGNVDRRKEHEGHIGDGGGGSFNKKNANNTNNPRRS
jgi:hypothetical protein